MIENIFQEVRKSFPFFIGLIVRDCFFFFIKSYCLTIVKVSVRWISGVAFLGEEVSVFVMTPFDQPFLSTLDVRLNLAYDM